MAVSCFPSFLPSFLPTFSPPSLCPLPQLTDQLRVLILAPAVSLFVSLQCSSTCSPSQSVFSGVKSTARRVSCRPLWLRTKLRPAVPLCSFRGTAERGGDLGTSCQHLTRSPFRRREKHSSDMSPNTKDHHHLHLHHKGGKEKNFLTSADEKNLINGDIFTVFVIYLLQWWKKYSALLLKVQKYSVQVKIHISVYLTLLFVSVDFT